MKIFFVVKKKLLRFAATAERPANPLFQGPCNHCSPKFFLRSPIIPIAKYRALKHGVGPLLICDWLSVLLFAVEGP